MNKKNRVKRYLAIDLFVIIFLTALDQWTKALVSTHLKDAADIILIPGVFQLHYLENRGAAFGILQNQRFVFVILTLLYLAAAAWFFNRCPKNKKYFLLHLIAAVLTAGALGNFIDRLRLGYVVDFFYFSLINFPIFNVADIFVVAAFIGITASVLFLYKDEDFSFLSLKKKER